MDSPPCFSLRMLRNCGEEVKNDGERRKRPMREGKGRKEGMAFPPLSLLLQFAAKDEFGNFPRSTAFSCKSKNTISIKPAVRYCARLRRPKTTLVRAIHWRSHIFYFRGLSRGEIISGRGQTRRPHNNYYHFSHDPHCIHPRHPPRRATRAAEWARAMDEGEDNGDAKKTVAAPDADDDDRQRPRSRLMLSCLDRASTSIHGQRLSLRNSA